MAEDASYVAIGEDGTVLAVMALSFSGEETYDQIDGAWLTESDSREPRYAVIHRWSSIAVLSAPPPPAAAS